MIAAKVTLGISIVLASSSAWAGNFTGKPVGPIFADGHVGLARPVVNTVRKIKQGVVQHKASGEHKCWSTVEIGRTCTVEGINYIDCNQAFYALKAQDCCMNMNVHIFGKSYQSNSVEFRKFTCGKM